MTKKYSDPRITPILVISCALVYAALLAFNLVTQGKGEISESLLLSRPQNAVDEKGSSTQCRPASLKLGDSFYTVDPGQAEDELETLGIAQSPGSFQWTIGDISRPTMDTSGQVYTGFFYDGDSVSCNVTSASFTYEFQEVNYKYSLCSVCLLQTYAYHVKLCTNFDLSITNPPNFAKELQESLQSRLSNIDAFYGNLVVGSHTLPLSAYPPSYRSDQADLFRNVTFSNRDVTQVSIWIGDIDFQPSTRYKFRPNNDGSNEMLQGKLFVHDSETPADFLTAFASTSTSSSSGFQLSVLGIGGVRPLGNEFDLKNLPDSISGLFQDSCATLSWMMNAAGADLNRRTIGATYLCTRTAKRWKPFLTLVSVAIGSSAGVFGAFLTVMIFVARKYDRKRSEEQDSVQENDQLETGGHTSKAPEKNAQQG